MARVKPSELGNLAASGWRAKVADRLSDPIAQRTPLEPDQARAAVGAAFFLLSVLYVVKTVRAAGERIRA